MTELSKSQDANIRKLTDEVRSKENTIKNLTKQLEEH